MLYLVILLFITIFLVIIQLVKINILVEYLRSGWDDHIVLSVSTLGGLLKYKYEIPLVDLEKSGLRLEKVKEKKPGEKDDGKEKGHLRFFEMLEKMMAIKDLYEENKGFLCDVWLYLKGKLVLREYKLDIDFGTGDACYTGILSGFIWAVAGVLTALLLKSFKVIKKNVRVSTDFMEKKFNIDFYCIFDVKIVHIIVVGLKILLSNKLASIRQASKNFKGGGIVG